VVCVYLEAATTTITTGVKVNSISLAPVVSYATVNGMQQAIYAGVVAAGGTQAVEVTTVNAFPSGVHVMVGTITGSATTAVANTANVPSAASPDPHSITATVPTNGVAVVTMLVDRPFTPVITGATSDGKVNNPGSNACSSAMGHGTASTVSFTGANGFGLGLLMATWGP
jgi:hypothetical protein